MTQNEVLGALRDIVRAEWDLNVKFAKGVCAEFFVLRWLSVIFAGISLVAATIPDIGEYRLEKWVVASSLAMSGAFYLAIQQMKQPERANAHFHRADLLSVLLLQIDAESVDGKSADLDDLCKRYANIIDQTGAAFARVNMFFATPVTNGGQN